MLLATLPPYVQHRHEIAAHPRVHGLRFNTVMPIAEPKADVLAALVDVCGDKPLWIDLKARQLRITRFAYLPMAFVDISRKISLDLPAEVYFKDGISEVVRIVGGDRLILSQRPSRVVGAGEPINILDPSLRIEGFLTDADKEYVEAAKSLDLHRYLLSFVETEDDLAGLFELDPEAQVIAKIESVRGLDFVRGSHARYADRVRLMAARDDLYINMGADKAAIFEALRLIIDRDPRAVLASRILTSLERDATVSLADLSDLHLMRDMGYRAFMLSDGLCFSRRAFRRAMDIWEQCHDGEEWRP